MKDNIVNSEKKRIEGLLMGNYCLRCKKDMNRTGEKKRRT